MEKNTIIAIVLIALVILVGAFIQTTFFSSTPDAGDAISTVMDDDTQTIIRAGADMAWDTGIPGSFTAVGTEPSSVPFVYETEMFIITFDPVGASVSSIKLKKHLDKGEPVELLFRGENDHNAFLMYAGDDHTAPIDAVFASSTSANQVVFTRNFALINQDGSISDEYFTITKTFNFVQNDYLFEMKIDVSNSVNKAIPLNYNSFAYTLGFEPQIGPGFEELANNNYNYRNFYFQKDGAKKKSSAKLSNGVFSSADSMAWVALVGKYFSFIAIPDASRYTVTLTTENNSNAEVTAKSNMYFSRPAMRSAVNTDTFRFYCGPQLKNNMTIYNDAADNSWGLSNLHLERAIDSSSWLGWLENILKWVLQLFYKIIPNYGVAIILLTILIKVLLYPLSRKGLQSTARMTELNPKVEELRERYKDNPQKMNLELSELYKREKINPVGGCLPMLIQFPVFIALYGLLNKHFELRGAMFIPGWIPDLSMPDVVFTLPFKIPILGAAIHLLPIIYTVSMIFSMKITQTGAQSATQSNGMMKFMTWGMPIIFFFVLYNAPSGLLVYWSVTNALSIVQQLFVNNKRQKTKDSVGPSKTKKAPVTKKFPTTQSKKRK